MQDDLDHRWLFLEKIPFPWLRALYCRVPKARIPVLSGNTLCIGTDTSGLQRGSRYIVNGILIVDVENSRSWEMHRRQVRRDFLNDGRRMSYKALNDRQRRDALGPFLEASDGIRGLCVVMAFDKRLHDLCGSEALYQKALDTGVITGRWNPKSFEQMMRTVQLVATLLASVCTKKQNVYWISDLDECFATAERKMDTARMMSSFTSTYIPGEMGELGVGTTEIDEGDRFEEDLTAVADLAAGAVCDLLNRMHEHLGSFPLLPTLVPTLKGKTDFLSSWFFHEKSNLVKLAWVARFIRSGHMQVGHFSTQADGSVLVL